MSQANHTIATEASNNKSLVGISEC